MAAWNDSWNGPPRPDKVPLDVGSGTSLLDECPPTDKNCLRATSRPDNSIAITSTSQYYGPLEQRYVSNARDCSLLPQYCPDLRYF